MNKVPTHLVAIVVGVVCTSAGVGFLLGPAAGLTLFGVLAIVLGFLLTPTTATK